MSENSTSFPRRIFTINRIRPFQFTSLPQDLEELKWRVCSVTVSCHFQLKILHSSQRNYFPLSIGAQEKLDEELIKSRSRFLFTSDTRKVIMRRRYVRSDYGSQRCFQFSLIWESQILVTLKRTAIECLGMLLRSTFWWLPTQRTSSNFMKRT